MGSSRLPNFFNVNFSEIFFIEVDCLSTYIIMHQDEIYKPYKACIHHSMIWKNTSQVLVGSNSFITSIGFVLNLFQFVIEPSTKFNSLFGGQNMNIVFYAHIACIKSQQLAFQCKWFDANYRHCAIWYGRSKGTLTGRSASRPCSGSFRLSLLSFKISFLACCSSVLHFLFSCKLFLLRCVFPAKLFVWSHYYPWVV